MVSEVVENTNVNNLYPQIGNELQEAAAKKKADSNQSTVIVSKEFILNILSLAIRKPFFLESNLGRRVDLKL